ncbi:hypothetical protein GGR50DRAFT_226933 [Xylaria sp. CBS 124048]|nr:hypothetical protein GGR50DRAFT_226933 [Xylaria sp. CBS 124048]
MPARMASPFKKLYQISTTTNSPRLPMSPLRKYSPTKFFIPGRNSRHRIACLALYRAFMRLAPKVSLPDDLATAWGEGRNPIVIQIRRAFRRNTTDTSPRIIFPALSAGYRMLEVLHGAATSPASEHYTSVTAFLRDRLAERKHSLDVYVPPPPLKPGAPRPLTKPLLVNVAPPPTPENPYPTPQYITPDRPRPLSELGGSGRRQIPRLDLADGVPFLRIKKPQPALLSRVLRQKIVRRVKRVESAKQMLNEDMEDARLEDDWEEQVADLLADEEDDNRAWNDSVYDARPGGRNETYASALHQYGVKEMTALLETERVDRVARADAMRKLIAEETVLATQEKAQRDAERRARWEAKMQEEHGDRWRDLFPKMRARDERLKAERQKAERQNNGRRDPAQPWW